MSASKVGAHGAAEVPLWQKKGKRGEPLGKDKEGAKGERGGREGGTNLESPNLLKEGV